MRMLMSIYLVYCIENEWLLIMSKLLLLFQNVMSKSFYISYVFYFQWYIIINFGKQLTDFKLNLVLLLGINNC